MNKFTASLMFGLSLLVSNGHAATITWAAAQNITGDSDVSTAGTLFQAAHLGDSSVVSTTVNGVTFTAFVIDNQPTTATQANFSIFHPIFLGGVNNYGTANDVAPVNTLSNEYRELLNFGLKTSHNESQSPMFLTISGLTLGHQYQFQWWANDSRGFLPGNDQTATGLNAIVQNAMTLSTNTSIPFAGGGLGQYGIGTFTADNGDFLADYGVQSISFHGVSDNMTNAFQLRDITSTPEPTRLMLMGLSLGALLMRRRRASC